LLLAERGVNTTGRMTWSMEATRSSGPPPHCVGSPDTCTAGGDVVVFIVSAVVFVAGDVVEVSANVSTPMISPMHITNTKAIRIAITVVIDTSCLLLLIAWREQKCVDRKQSDSVLNQTTKHRIQHDNAYKQTNTNRSMSVSGHPSTNKLQFFVMH
jgi:hypothetical protein